MKANPTGAFWFGLGTFIPFATAGEISVYVINVDPLLGRSISFYIWLLLAGAAWLVGAGAFAVGARYLNIMGRPIRFLLLGAAVAALWPLMVYGINYVGDFNSKLRGWLLLAIFIVGSFFSAKLAVSKRVVG